jgi:hypothetical protein
MVPARTKPGRTRFLASLAFVLLLAAETGALEFRNLDASELVRRSTEIVHAVCLSAEGVRMEDGDIFTEYAFSPFESIKGIVADPFSFRLHGGAVGDESVMIPDMPTFAVGREYVLFLDNGRLILSGSFEVLYRAGVRVERVLASIPPGLKLNDAVSEKSLGQGNEVSLENFFYSIKKLMEEDK